jgi:hygromycin-B 4-O-kinase
MECSPTERWALLPQLLDTLEALGEADTSASAGYGGWDDDGNGHYESWQACLTDMIENHDEGYYANWHRFFERMVRLSERCPNVRQLVHNDYQFENVMTDGKRISGVIDWGNALYGDPLYDVAWLGFLSIHPGWWFDDGVEILRERFGNAPEFEARIACYELHIGLDHLRFYVANDRYEDYQICREWLLARVGGDASPSS